MRCIDTCRRVARWCPLVVAVVAGGVACDGSKPARPSAAASAASAAAAISATVESTANAATAAGTASQAAAASTNSAAFASPATSVNSATAPAIAVAATRNATRASTGTAASAATRTAAVRPLLPPPHAPASADDLRLQFAQRLVAAHPDGTYLTPAPDRLLAIPVLEVELNADGSVRHIAVLRRPTTGHEGSAATLMAIAAVRRAAPFGNVSKLPKPWKVVETFLFDDRLHFKPRSLDP